jgi:hypothetical protein
MKNICYKSLLYSLGTTVWIILVAFFMQKANNWFGTQDSIISVVAVLLLFSTSALVVGGLLIGNSIFLYIDGKKKEAVQMLLANAGWMLCYFVIAIIALTATK